MQVCCTVTVVPEIVEFPEDAEVMEGERVAFGVRVTGTPDPKLIWYHNGVEVVPDYSRELGEDGTLSMPSAEAKHGGVYELVAHNPGGRAEREVRLTVREEDEEEKGVSTAHEMPTTGIAVPFFGNFVEKCHSNQNQAFKDQYQVINTQYIIRLYPEWTVIVCWHRVCTMETKSQQPLPSTQTTNPRTVS